MLRNGLRVLPRAALTPALNKLNQITQAVRFALRFNGVNTFGRLPFRAINIEGDNTFEFWSPTALTGGQTIISQNISSTSSLMEFRFVVGGGGALEVTFGGANTVLMTVAQGFKPSTRYGLSLVGTAAQIFEGGLNGSLVRTASFTRGAAREPTAPTVIGARQNGSGSFLQFFQGPQYDIRINGVLWPMADRNMQVQLPNPSGLGAELITQTVLENPSIRGNQWTYLGNGRWQYIGDGQGGVAFISSSNLPDAAVLDFEVESYQLVSGTGSMRVSPTITNFFGDRLFAGVGLFRCFYTSRPASIEFTRNNSGTLINCIIRNISFRPLISGYGAELVSNGGFNNATGWNLSGGAQITGGEIAFNSPGVSTAVAPVATVNSRRYEMTYTIRAITSGSVRAILYGNGMQYVSPSRTAAGTYTEIVEFTATGGSFNNAINIQAGHVSNTVAFVDNVSVREITNLCNPLVLNNVVPEQWEQIPA